MLTLNYLHTLFSLRNQLQVEPKLNFTLFPLISKMWCFPPIFFFFDCRSVVTLHYLVSVSSEIITPISCCEYFLSLCGCRAHACASEHTDSYNLLKMRKMTASSSHFTISLCRSGSNLKWLFLFFKIPYKTYVTF